MADWGKVIKGLEMCLASIDEAECPKECPYYETCRKYEKRVIFQPVMRDALELLKKFESRKPDCEHAEHDGAGCLGYAGCSQDDEPIEACKECDAYTGNRTERR